MRPISGVNPVKSTMAETLVVAGKLLLFAALGYGLLSIGVHLLSRSMLFPRPQVKYELGSDYVTLTAMDGTKLAARHWPVPGAKYTVLYLHGNYEELGRLAEYLPAFTQAGYAVFAFDYRGYGHSEGSPTETNLYTDSELAHEFLRTKLGVPADRIIVFGYSLGSGPAVELALRQPVAGLVLQGAFVSAYRVMTRVPLFPGDKFANLAKAPALRCPVLVIHGTADTTVPFWHGARLFEAITAPKAKLFVEGGPHTGLADFAGPAYTEALHKFTDSL